MRYRFCVTIAAGLLLGLVACKGKDEPAKTTKPAPGKPTPRSKHTASSKRNPTAVKANPAWNKFVNGYIEAYLVANPHRAVSAGRHEFDGKVPDQSKAGILAEIKRLHTALAKAKVFRPETLSPAQRFEREYFIARLEGELFWYEDAKSYERLPFFYAWPINPTIYVTREYAPLATRMKAMVTLQKNIPAVVANLKANMKTPLPKTVVQLAVNMFGGYAGFFKNAIPKVFAPVKDAALQTEFATANKAAVAAFEDVTKWFREQQKTATDDFAIGAELYAKMLAKTERVTTPIAELEKIGQADLDRNLAALAEACAQVAPKQPVARCIELVQADKPKAGPVLRAREQLGELEAFLRKVDVVTIPGKERATVDEAPPYSRFNFAYINIPGLWEKPEVPAVYYIAPPDPKWTAKERAAYLPGESDLMFVSVHEVWPGHFLNYLHAKRSPSKFGRLFVGYAFSEGWAHYTEEMMWDVGLSKGNAKARVGQLVNALLRNVRFLSSIRLHTGGMTVADSEKMFREKAFQDPGNARQQAARGTFDPAYLNYTLGKLMIRKLRDDWCKDRGGRKAWKAFHDKFLSYGGPALPLVRKAMLGAADDGKLF